VRRRGARWDALVGTSLEVLKGGTLGHFVSFSVQVKQRRSGYTRLEKSILSQAFFYNQVLRLYKRGS